MVIERTSRSRYGIPCFGVCALLALAGAGCGSSTGGATGRGGSGGGGSGGSGGSGGTMAGTAGAGATGTGGTTGSGGSAGGGTTTGAAGSGDSTAGAGGSSSAGAAGSGGSGGGAGSAGGTAGHGGSAAAGRGGTTGTAGAAGSRGGASGTAGAAGGGGGSSGSSGLAGAMPSAGCTAAGGAPASGHYTIDASGTMREYIIKMPANYDPHHPYRLILAFHGRMYDAASVDSGGAPSKEGAYYGIEPMSGGGAIFVAPQALSTSWTNANDIPYVDAMIARFKSQLCIDQNRIFATGFSMGAIQTIALGCAEGNVFRAIAPMSGEVSGTCAGANRIAYWGSHGKMDPTIDISNGRAARDTFRMIDHCTTQTVATTPSGCVSYQGCDAGYPINWCEFDGVHEPPPFSGEGIWGFFSQF